MLKVKISVITLIIVIISAILSTNSLIINGQIEGELNFRSSIINSFNATASDNYFNETKDPRYYLVNRPLTLLYYPNKGYPIITEYSKPFSIKVSAPEDTTRWNLSLVSDTTNVSLSILKTKYDSERNQWVIEVFVEKEIQGLFDLKLVCSAGNDYQTHSVKLVKKFSYPFTFVQISDSHFPGYAPDINTTAVNLEVIQKVKDLNPDFVIHTGDVIDGPNTVFVDPKTGKTLAAEVQLKLGLWALDKLDAPVFIIAGNHDFDKSNLLPDDPEEVWNKYFGYSRIQNFSFLDWDFTGYSASFEGLSEYFETSLREHLKGTSNGSDVLYYHYDFKEQATKILKKYHIEIALWGHEHRERFFYSQGTLYHCQDAMFKNSDSFTLFTMESENIFSVKEETFNTSTFKIENTNEIQTTKTPFSTISTLFIFFSAITVHMIKKRKKKTD
ncbi:MAG: metallophosphoesterase [Candidatus Heimdallarchaeum endolithica]|uniref:Metallophosphoesterase n=1 Tax=Candidatus Heimdallarchaeum endolithica TaxID=2876572 RepID=A0A9Y1BSA5_9ARCH|nr:MAG: metallophosphoesterase [Candidatus Heimdallarchaeum endolithica]